MSSTRASSPIGTTDLVWIYFCCVLSYIPLFGKIVNWALLKVDSARTSSMTSRMQIDPGLPDSTQSINKAKEGEREERRYPTAYITRQVLGHSVKRVRITDINEII